MGKFLRNGRTTQRAVSLKRAGRLPVIVASFGLALLGGTRGTQDAVANGDTRTLSIYHTHTKESLTVTFKRDGRYDRAALEQLNWLLRDWRVDEPIKMDPRLFDTVWEAYRSVGSQEPINVVSAYRSPGTNAMLRRRSKMVAEYSQHMLGKAMDFYLPDVSIDQIRAIGMRMQRGGVGWYPRSNSPFVHLDVGSVRSWPRMTHDQLARLFPDGKTVHLPSDNRPLPGYETARTEILARGGTVLGITEVAQMDEDDGPSIKGFFASLFGGGSQDTVTPVQMAAKASMRPRPKATAIVVASADPEDPVGARSALAYAAPATDEALKSNLLDRDGRDAQSLLTGETQAAAKSAPDAAFSASLPLPPRRPAEFVAVTAALTMPLPPPRPAVHLAGLGNAGMVHLTPDSPPHAVPVPANADSRTQLHALFVAAATDVEPASRAAPVKLAKAKAKLDGAPTAIVLPQTGIATRFSARSPGDDLAASRFTGSATRVVPGNR